MPDTINECIPLQRPILASSIKKMERNGVSFLLAETSVFNACYHLFT